MATTKIKVLRKIHIKQRRLVRIPILISKGTKKGGHGGGSSES